MKKIREDKGEKMEKILITILIIYIAILLGLIFVGITPLILGVIGYSIVIGILIVLKRVK